MRTWLHWRSHSGECCSGRRSTQMLSVEEGLWNVFLQWYFLLPSKKPGLDQQLTNTRLALALKAQNFSSQLKLRVGYHQILAKFVNFFRAISPKIFTFCNYHSPHHISMAKMSQLSFDDIICNPHLVQQSHRVSHIVIARSPLARVCRVARGAGVVADSTLPVGPE